VTSIQLDQPLKIAVVYYSKTGNTKIIADNIARVLGCKSFAINLIKQGRKTKHEIDQEKQLLTNAIEICNQSDLVFIGTPTEFRKPHSKIVYLIDKLSPIKAAIFCTYYGMLGATFYDLEALLLKKNITIINKLSVLVGTEKYKFSRDINQYKDMVTSEHIDMSTDFALNSLNSVRPLRLRLKGICGKDCQLCSDYGISCKGAGYNCWSGSHCEIFNCSVIKKSYSYCEDCNNKSNCVIIKNQNNLRKH
jgi:flavodoxin